MGNNLLLIYGILTIMIVGGTSFIVFIVFNGIFKRFKFRDEHKLCSFKRKRFNGDYFLLLLVTRFYFDFNRAESLYRWKKSDVKVENIIDYFNTRNMFYKIVLICIAVLVIVTLIDIIIGFILESGLYEDGILLFTGKFIPWSDVKKVHYKNTIMGYSKIIQFYTSNEKYKEVYVKNKNLNKLLNIISEKSSIDIYKVTTNFDNPS